MSNICCGYLDVVRGNSVRACDPKLGGFHKAVESGMETGSALIAARAKVEHSRFSYQAVPSKIYSSLSALEVFQSAGAVNDNISCLLLLAQLDPKSVEFREMARLSMMRKSSARKSKGNSNMVVADLEEMEDVPLAGRKDELMQLIKATNALRTTTGAAEKVTLVVEATGGMGKSALVKSFMKDVQASMHGVQIRASSASQVSTTERCHIFAHAHKLTLAGVV